MKLLLDLLPLALFFIVFKLAEGQPEAAAQFATAHLGQWVQGGLIAPTQAPILLATGAVMAGTLLQVTLLKLLRQRIDLLLWLSLGLVMLFGGLTLYFHSETFIKLKPSLLYGLIALGLLAGQRWAGRNLLKPLLQDLPLPEPVWQRLLWAWVGFFGFMAALNLAVAYSVSTSAWASFKVFGALGLTLLFTLAQGLYISHVLPPEKETP